MNLSPDIPDNIDALKVALIAARTDLAEVKTDLISAQTHAVHVESELATAQARVSDDQALIAHLKLMIAKLNRDLFGPRSERTARLLDQMELQLEELEATATEDELADVLGRIAGHPAHRIDDLLPWNWKNQNAALKQAA